MGPVAWQNVILGAYVVEKNAYLVALGESWGSNFPYKGMSSIAIFSKWVYPTKVLPVPSSVTE